MSADTTLLYFEREDGTAELLPADHMARVTTLLVALFDAPDAGHGRRLLLDVKADPGLDRNYGQLVMLAALEQLFLTLMHHGTPFEVVHTGAFLPGWINITNAPLASDYLPGSHDNR